MERICLNILMGVGTVVASSIGLFIIALVTLGAAQIYKDVFKKR